MASQRIVNFTAKRTNENTVITVNYINRRCRKVNTMVAVDNNNFEHYENAFKFAMEYWDDVYTALRKLGFKVVGATEEHIQLA